MEREETSTSRSQAVSLNNKIIKALITFIFFITRHINNNNDMKITSKEHDNSGDEKEINESILMLGERLLDNSYSLIPESCSLFTNSDQESTSGEEDVLGMFPCFRKVFLELQVSTSFHR